MRNRPYNVMSCFSFLFFFVFSLADDFKCLGKICFEAKVLLTNNFKDGLFFFLFFFRFIFFIFIFFFL